jgi:peptide/nickel transport system permease protein
VLRYIVINTIQAVVTLLALSVIIFGLARVSGDPTLLYLPPFATQEDHERLLRLYGLDKPIHVQYRIFITNALRGDFGASIYGGRPVNTLIGERLHNTVKLVGVSLLMAVFLGVPLGVWAAVRKQTFVDSFARIVAGLAQALPSFWLALMLILIFAAKLNLLPTSGMGSWRHYIMPAFAISYFMAGGIIRLLRSSMLDVLDSEYIKMARIKGVSERVIIWKHALRNSLLPVVSFGGVYIAVLISGSIVVETVFAWPGFGRLCYQAITTRDFPLMQGVVLVTATIVMIANILTDILYAYLDPRIKYEEH